VVEATEVESVDVSIPYDAAAKLAYHALSDDERSKIDYSTFQQQYTEKAVADVIAKKGRPATTTPTVATTVASTTTTTSSSTSDTVVDVRVPYDAAAQLAYTKLQSIKHSLTYEQFRLQYERNAVTNVMAKKAQREQQQA
jgi:hypothetical protein